MSENTYLEQYLNQVILPLYLHNLLMEALNEVKEQKNAGQLKKVHELIDRVEKSGKKLALYEKVFLELMVTDYKYMMEQGWKRMTREEAIVRLKLDRDLCNFNPMTGEEEPMSEDCRKSAEALDIAIKALDQVAKLRELRKITAEKERFYANQPNDNTLYSNGLADAYCTVNALIDEIL